MGFLMVLIGSFCAGCAVRQSAPLKFIPGVGEQPDYSMESILQVALKDKNPAVRKDAVRLLGTMINTPEEQRRSAVALGQALKDKDEGIRLEAVRALGNIDPKFSGMFLAKALKDESVRVRVQVVQELRDAYRRQSEQIQAVGQPPTP
jgi:HEAT repeat protein